MKCQILTRGLIPGIMIRGPVANIELTFDTICDLLDRGVDIRREDGSPFDRIPLDQQPKKVKRITTIQHGTPPKAAELGKEPDGHPDPVGPVGQPGVPVVKEDPREAEAFSGVVDEIIDQSADVLAEQQARAMEAEHPSPDDLEEDGEDEDGDEPVPATPADPSNPYAGMSKNQIKKAKRAAKAAAAEAAAKNGESAQ